MTRLNSSLRIGVASVGLSLLLSAGITALVAIPPTFSVYLNGAFVGSGQDLTVLAGQLQTAARQMGDRSVTLAAGDQRWSFHVADLGLSVPDVDLQAGFARATADVGWWRRLPGAHLDVRVTAPTTWNEARLEAAVRPLAEAVAKPPVPAVMQILNRTPTITPEVPGLALDTAGLMQVLKLAPDGAVLQVPVKPVLPEVTKGSLEAMHVRKLVAEWTTHYDPSIPRADNVEKAARAFDKLLLKPGEILSYNATVGPIDASTGWKEAYVFEDGQIVRGIGGGVCQVATTFYGAALRANLEIVERHQHQLAVSYIDPSQDAAIAPGYEDLKLRNTMLGYLYIETESGGGSVTFRLYGDVPDGQTVQIESRVLSSRPFPTRLITDRSLKAGQRMVQFSGSQGFTSEAYRLVYQDGKLVKREKLSEDDYLPTTQVILVGPMP